ncbi:MAG: glycerophosphodiester phosphodiesterase family protein [Candidatus Faecivicinus sp.]
MALIIIIVILLALAIFLLAPSPGRRRAEDWRGTMFAHRGLHGAGAAENTLEAFERACRAGFGIELDVQLSRDGAVVVFHDDALARMTGDARRVEQVDLAGLQALSLKGKGRIPTFEEVLKCVDGRVPLLVEIKNGRHNRRLCEETLRLLRGYRGRYLVESFNPLILRWLRKNAPEVVRGQLVGAPACYLGAHFGRAGAFLLSSLALNFLARPDFVAYDVAAAHFSAPRIQRALFHTPLAAWTVRDSDVLSRCLSQGEMAIFEAFVPEHAAGERGGEARGHAGPGKAAHG